MPIPHKWEDRVCGAIGLFISPPTKYFLLLLKSTFSYFSYEKISMMDKIDISRCSDFTKIKIANSLVFFHRAEYFTFE